MGGEKKERSVFPDDFLLPEEKKSPSPSYWRKEKKGGQGFERGETGKKKKRSFTFSREGKGERLFFKGEGREKEGTLP